MQADATIALGTGEEQFVPIANGDSVLFEQGTQGLFHLFGSLSLTGIVPGDVSDFSDPTNPTVSISVTHQGEIIGGYQSLPRPLDVGPNGTLTLIGDIVLLDIHSLSEADGLEVTMTSEILDYCGTQLSDIRSFSLIASSQ